MNEEQREAVRAANKRRTNCPQCGGSEIVEHDGKEIMGLPGITYRCCTACGWAKAKTKKIPKFKL